MGLKREKDQKELLTEENIKKDLLRSEKKLLFERSIKWASPILGLIAMPAAVWWIAFQYTLAGQIAAIVSLGVLIIYLFQYRKSLIRRKMVKRGGYTVTEDRLCGSGTEVVFNTEDGRSLFQEAWFLYFTSQKWRVPEKNFLWSEQNQMTRGKILYTSSVDDRFYVVLFNDTYDIGCAYPAQFFVWEGDSQTSLKGGYDHEP